MGLRVVFMGTPDFAVATLETLVKSPHKVVGVVTVPDKPAGRGQKLQYSAVKEYALAQSLPVLQPEKLKDESFLTQLEKFDAEIFVVVAFRMLPVEVWSMPRLGSINLHGSLLPQYRGAAPINWAVINGEKETGVTTFFIQKDIDTGSILFSEKLAIEPTDTAGDIHDKLMGIGAGLVSKTLDSIERRQVRAVQQSQLIGKNDVLKPAPKIFKDDCRISWNKSTIEIYNLIRGLSPYPAAWSVLSDKNNEQLSVKIFKTEMIIKETNYKPGTILTDGKKQLQVSTADGFINIMSLQAEGKKKLDTDEFLRGFHGIENYHFE
jgi:methionyl-tRNA formyltransferase